MFFLISPLFINEDFKDAKLYSIEFLRTEMMSDLSN